MTMQWKSLLSVCALVVSSTGLMAAYTVPMWKPADVLKSTAFQFLPVEESEATKSSDALQNNQIKSQSAELLQDVAAPSSDAGKNIKNHRVRLTPDGYIKGTVAVNSLSGEPINVENARVLLIQNGNIKTESKTKADGSFQLKDAGVGNYSVFIVGVNAFMAYGIEVVPPLATTSTEQTSDVEGLMNVTMVEQAESFIKSTAVPPRDFKILNQIIDQYMPNIRKKSVQANSTAGSAGPIPDPISNNDGADLLPAEEVSEKYEPDPSISSNDVLLNDNNELVGRVKRYHPKENQPVRLRQMQAFLIKNGNKLYAPIREDGTFVFKNVEPGPYSFAAAGLDGFSALGLNVKSSGGSQLASADTSRELVLELVNMVEGGGAGGTLSSQEDTKTGVGEQDKEKNPDPSQDPANPPPGNPPAGNQTGSEGGGNGGGSGGGAGGGGGGGILGPLLGAAGLGLGAAALADDSNDVRSP